MAYTSGSFTGILDLKAVLISYLTNTTIHGDDAWELVADNGFPKGTYFKVKGINEDDHFYIGMMYNEITSDTYKNWLYSGTVMRDKVANNILGITDDVVCTNTNNNIYTWNKQVISNPGHYYPYVWTQEPVYHKIVDTKCTANMSIVKEYDDGREYGKILSFGVFKQFDENLNWDEQGGALNYIKHPIPMMNFFRLLSGNLNQKMAITPPTMPGIGYPLLYTSNVNGVFDYPVSKYWIVKDKYSINVIVKNGKYWRTICVGMLPCYGEGTYPFPAMQVGSLGLTANGVNSPTSGDPDPTVGISLDLSDDDASFCNSLPIFPTRGVKSKFCPTQCAIMNPDGIWQFHGNFAQPANIFRFRMSGNNPVFAYPLYPPELYSPDEARLYPTDIDLSEYENGRNYSDITPHSDTFPMRGVYDYSRELTKVMLNQNLTVGEDGGSPDKITSVSSYIPRMFYTNTEPIQFGEIDTEEGKVLVIPNVWQGRLSWYKYYLNTDGATIPYDFWAREVLKTSYENMTYTYGNRHRMAIKLEGDI